MIRGGKPDLWPQNFEGQGHLGWKKLRFLYKLRFAFITFVYLGLWCSNLVYTYLIACSSCLPTLGSVPLRSRSMCRRGHPRLPNAVSCLIYTTYSVKFLWTQLLLQFSKDFHQTFTDEQPQHVDVHEGRNLRCDDFCQNYGPLCFHSLYAI